MSYCKPCEKDYSEHPVCKGCELVVGKYVKPLTFGDETYTEHFGGSCLTNGLCERCIKQGVTLLVAE